MVYDGLSLMTSFNSREVGLRFAVHKATKRRKAIRVMKDNFMFF